VTFQIVHLCSQDTLQGLLPAGCFWLGSVLPHTLISKVTAASAMKRRIDEHGWDSFRTAAISGKSVDEFDRPTYDDTRTVRPIHEEKLGPRTPWRCSRWNGWAIRVLERRSSVRSFS